MAKNRSDFYTNSKPTRRGIFVKTIALRLPDFWEKGKEAIFIAPAVTKWYGLIIWRGKYQRMTDEHHRCYKSNAPFDSSQF